ncbi:MAG: hypothetical protein CEN90_461 [Parcubacteria group bacterium Licking1014_17]|nr:MAG: hypothetical protein CEN90_461 [Parcubacteria group bacterium Licking1014_17]
MARRYSIVRMSNRVQRMAFAMSSSTNSNTSGDGNTTNDRRQPLLLAAFLVRRARRWLDPLFYHTGWFNRLRGRRCRYWRWFFFNLHGFFFEFLGGYRNLIRSYPTNIPATLEKEEPSIPRINRPRRGWALGHLNLRDHSGATHHLMHHHTGGYFYKHHIFGGPPRYRVDDISPFSFGESFIGSQIFLEDLKFLALRKSFHRFPRREPTADKGVCSPNGRFPLKDLGNCCWRSGLRSPCTRDLDGTLARLGDSSVLGSDDFRTKGEGDSQRKNQKCQQETIKESHKSPPGPVAQKRKNWFGNN